jgi:GH24 family phage-related lysozyme (muramidase)
MSKASPAVDGSDIPADSGVPTLPQSVYDMIIDAEGLDQPFKFPGGDSGVSLGRGYDLSAETRAELLNDWTGWLADEQLQRLTQAVGKKGEAARQACSGYRDIQITNQMADDVFYSFTVPKYYATTKTAFPGVEKLPGSAQGALLSLVFNRGPSMTGDRRTEMRAIRDAIANGDPINNWADLRQEIASQFRSMKRLWVGTDVSGLVARRETEAELVEAA